MVLRWIYFLIFICVLNAGFSQVLYRSHDLKEWDSLIPRYSRTSKLVEHSIRRLPSSQGRMYEFFTPNNISDTNQFVMLHKNFSGLNFHAYDSIEIKVKFFTESDWGHHAYYPNFSIWTFNDSEKWKKVGGMYTYKKMSMVDSFIVHTTPFIQMRLIFKTWASNETTLGVGDVEIKGLGSVFSTMFEIFNDEIIDLYSKEGKIYVKRKSSDPITIKLYDLTWRLIDDGLNKEVNSLELPPGIYFYVIQKEDLSFQRGKLSVE